MTDPPDDGEDDRASTGDERWLDRGLLSDLFVNAVPIAILVVFVAAFAVLSPGAAEDDPLVLFHGALIGGVVLVSAVAGWVIRREDAPLAGSAGDSLDGEAEDD